MSSVKRNEQGMVSILVTMIMILVITLIVLGFAQVTRRNQTEALDNQISSQAYYAAESGVNAAVNYLSAHAGYSASTVGNCTTFLTTLGGGTVNVLDSATNTKYTCLMVDPDPSSLNVAPLTQVASTVLHLANADGAGGVSEPFTSLQFQWTQQAQSNFAGDGCTSGNGGNLPTYGAWDCPYGILRLDLVDTSGANVSNTVLQNNQTVTSFYMVPSYTTGNNTTQVASAPDWQAVNPTTTLNACNSNAAGGNNCPVQIVHVRCTQSGNCSLKLNFPAGGGSSDYYARLSMMYQDSGSLTIGGSDASNTNGGVKFVGGQALIDSTGQSQDELRRVQVRVPLEASQGATPVYALQTTDSICKLLTDTGPNSTAVDHPQGNCP